MLISHLPAGDSISPVLSNSSRGGKFLRVKGVLQLLADGAAHLVGKAELQLREYLLGEDRPHYLVVEVTAVTDTYAFGLDDRHTLLAAVLNVKEPEVQRDEVLYRVAGAGDLRHG